MRGSQYRPRVLGGTRTCTPAPWGLAVTRCLTVPGPPRWLLSCAFVFFVEGLVSLASCAGTITLSRRHVRELHGGLLWWPVWEACSPSSCWQLWPGVTLQNTDAVAVCTDSSPSRASHPEGRGAWGVSSSLPGSDLSAPRTQMLTRSMLTRSPDTISISWDPLSSPHFSTH